jgi:hypothetical protein
MVRRLGLVALTVGLAACGATGSVSSSPASPTSPSPSPTSSSSEPPPMPTGQPPKNVVVDVPTPGAVLAAFGSVWVQERQDGSVWRLDRNGRVLAKIPHAVRAVQHLGSDVFTLGAGFGSVWALADGHVVRIDPDTNARIAEIAVPDHAFGLAVGPEGVWVSCCAGGLPSLGTIDPSSNAAHAVRDMPISPSSFAVGEGFVWWGDFSEAGAMQRFDPATGANVRIEATNMRFIVPTPRWTWLITAAGTTQRVASGSVRPAQDAGRKAPVAIGATYAHGVVWINAGDAVGFDATTGRTKYRVKLGRVRYQAAGGIAVFGGRVWVADPAADTVVGAPIV